MSWVNTDVIKKQLVRQIKSNDIVNVSEFGLSKSTCKMLPMIKGMEFDVNYPSIKKINILMEWLDNYRVKVYVKTNHSEDINIVGEGGVYVTEGNRQILSFNLSDVTSSTATNFKVNSIHIGDISDTQYSYNAPNGISSIISNAKISLNGVDFANFGYHSVLHYGNESKWIYKSGTTTYNINRGVSNNIDISIIYGSMKAYSNGYIYDYTLPWNLWKLQNVSLNISYDNINTSSLINLVIWEV